MSHAFPTRRASDRDVRLGGVSAQPRRRKVEQRGIVDRLEAWLHGIAETDIDDNCYAGPGERGCSAQADATILQLLADGSGLQRIEIKGHAIVASDRQDFAKYAEDALLAGIAKYQEIEVTAAAGCLRPPGRTEKRRGGQE